MKIKIKCIQNDSNNEIKYIGFDVNGKERYMTKSNFIRYINNSKTLSPSIKTKGGSNVYIVNSKYLRTDNDKNGRNDMLHMRSCNFVGTKLIGYKFSNFLYKTFGILR